MAATHASPSVYQSTQCVFTAGAIETGQLQAKRRPVTEFQRKEFFNRVSLSRNPTGYKNTHETKVDIISGNHNWNSTLTQLIEDTAQPKYYKVEAKLCQLFEKDFYIEHVKSGIQENL